MRKTTTLTAIALLLASSAAAIADGVSLKDAPATGDKLEWTANIAGASDYIFRGISQNDRRPTVQGGVDLTYGLWYAGVWASGVNFDASNATDKINAHQEIDVYGGIKPKYGNVTFDFGVISYNYPNVNVNHLVWLYDPNYIEFKAGASTTILNDIAVTGTIFVSPNYFGETGTTVTLEGSASKTVYKLGDTEFALSSTVGYVDYTERDTFPGTAIALNSYAYYNVGLTATYKAFSLDFRWWDTSLNDESAQCSFNAVNQCGSAFAVTGKVSF
jgi:uncharacterized protein (TIGR02001 family)